MLEIINQPAKERWSALAMRPSDENKGVTAVVKAIMEDIKMRGDEAVLSYNTKFDKNSRNSFAISSAQRSQLVEKLSKELKDAIDLAYDNIKRFHQSQKLVSIPVDIQEGIQCWRMSRPIDSVGLYIPGGSAPLFSSVLMLGVPAQLAGCPLTILCTPATNEGAIHPAIAYAAQLTGIDQVYGIGGAQAIAAMTYGTRQVPRVDKLFGPGNQYVTEAKVQAQLEGVAIDMPAGPSEVLVIANEASNPVYVAADLISQMEHGADSQAVLCTNDQALALAVQQALVRQTSTLTRADIIKAAAASSKIIVFDSIDDCITFSNLYAPEHLIMAYDEAEQDVEKIRNAGSIFLGKWSCESLGDYATGTNHTLPTSGYARAFSGVSLDSFVKKITVQKVDQVGIESIGPSVMTMAQAEGLDGHAAAVFYRLNESGYE